jgi:uncharacterized protein YjbI with pentapeptide repeats
VARKKPGRKKEPTSERGIAWPRWTGFRGKTFWDWLQLLIVPVALVVISFWFAWWQNNSQQALEARQQAQEAESQAQYAALQAYLDQMSQLMFERNLRGSEEGSTLRTLARARTRTVLAQLDGHRKGIVVQFLYEASLLDKENPVVSLSGVRLHDADLSYATPLGADLSGADLSDADLSGAYLFNADLRFANMSDTNLSGAYLNDADLSYATPLGADLSKADLSKADLSGATLLGAALSGAYLVETDLSEADLFDADLSYATGVTEQQLEEQAKNLEGATMPDGSIHH